MPTPSAPVRGVRTVLLVEDEPATRRLTYHALKHEWRVLEAADADAALAVLGRERVDLVVLDLHLPPEPGSAAHGLRVQKRIGAMESPIPVVVVSADGDPRVRAEALRDGAREVLLKPVDVEELIRVVRRLLAEGAR